MKWLELGNQYGKWEVVAPPKKNGVGAHLGDPGYDRDERWTVVVFGILFASWEVWLGQILEFGVKVYGYPLSGSENVLGIDMTHEWNFLCTNQLNYPLYPRPMLYLI